MCCSVRLAGLGGGPLSPFEGYLSHPIFSRPGQSQGLLYKQPSLIHQPFPPTALRCRYAQAVKDSSSSYEIDYVIVIKNSLDPEGNQNPINALCGSR